MHPILFKIPLPFGYDPLLIRSFGVMVMIGVLVGTFWLGRALRRLGLGDGNTVGDIATAAIVAGFLGARWTYLAIHPEAWHGPLSLIALWEGGIVSYGGFFGGAVGAIWWAKRKHLPLAPLSDAMLPALALGQVFGRIGCLLVGDDYGAPWDGPWAIRFPKPEGGLIPDDLVGVPLHPSQIYLSLMNLCVFLVCARMLARRRFDGQVGCLTMILYAIGRFSLEYTRGDDAARGIYGAFSTSQWWSLVTIVMASLLWWRLSKRPHVTWAADAADTHAPAGGAP